MIEQDHRFVKKKVRASQCFKTFHTAERTLEGVEAVNMMRKGQVKRLAINDIQGKGSLWLRCFRLPLDEISLRNFRASKYFLQHCRMTMAGVRVELYHLKELLIATAP